MNRLFLSFFLIGVLSLSASATTNVHKLSKRSAHKTSLVKKVLFDCCVTVQKSKEVSLWCPNTQSYYYATLTQTASWCGNNDCTYSFFKANQLADDQMMTAEAAWLSSRQVDCGLEEPIE